MRGRAVAWACIASGVLLAFGCGGASPSDSAVRCGEGTVAADGFCVPLDATGSKPKKCRPDLVEVNGWCVPPEAGTGGMPDASQPDASSGLKCGPGTISVAGTCVVQPRAACSDDTQCASGEVCVDHECRLGVPVPAPEVVADNPTALENAQTGTEDWNLSAPALAHEIEGYASRTSVNLGGSIALYVSTAALNYTIDVFRMGWYGGLGGKRVLPTIERIGTLQVTPAPDADGMVECDWIDPYVIDIPNDWVSGVYLAKLTEAESAHQSYIAFVVRDDARVSDFLFQSSVTTAQAYNNWGGKSVYDFNSTGARAHRVSFNRPYGLGIAGPDAAQGIGGAEFLASISNDAPSARGWEYPMVRYLEREGYDVSYATNIDTHEDAHLLDHHKVFLSVGHDEYWSWEMRANVESARDRLGTHLGFFSGNDCYWQIRLSPDQHGEPSRRMTVYKDTVLDPLNGTTDAHLVTGRWAEPPLDVSEAGMLGIRYQEGNVGGDYTVDDASSWPLVGTGLRKGDKLTGLLGYEVDAIPDGNLPAGIIRMMKSPWVGPYSSGEADTVVFQVPSGAWVFAAGSIQVSWGLDEWGNRKPAQPLASAEARRMTENVFERFLAPLQPSTSALLMSDDFASSLRDPARWAIGIVSEGEGAFDAAVQVSQHDTLSIAPRANVADVHHNGYVSATRFDMTHGMASVALVQRPNPASGANTSFALSADATHWVRFTLERGTLSLQARVGADLSTQTTAYDAIQHRILRLRRVSSSSEFVWEASADGQTFTTLRHSAHVIAVGAMRAELEAGTYQAEASPGTASFDDFKVAWTGLSDAFEGPRNAQFWTPAVMSEGEAAYDSAMAPIQYAGHIAIRPRVSAPAPRFGGYVSARTWDLSGGWAFAELSQVATGSAATCFALGLDASSWVRFRVQAGTLYMEDSATGVQTQSSVPYDSFAHRYLRFAHDRGTPSLAWQTSPDGVAWTSLRSKAPPIPVSALRVELSAGTAAAEPVPGETQFESFELATSLR